MDVFGTGDTDRYRSFFDYDNDDIAMVIIDNTDQLTAADYETGFQTDESFSYDANGNRTNTGYATGDHNRIESDGTHYYTHDHEGNQTEKFLWTDADSDQVIDESEKTYVRKCHWDHRNRLEKVEVFDASGNLEQVVEYAYDHENRMFRRTLDSDADGNVNDRSLFLYDEVTTRSSPNWRAGPSAN